LIRIRQTYDLAPIADRVLQESNVTI